MKLTESEFYSIVGNHAGEWDFAFAPKSNIRISAAVETCGRRAELVHAFYPETGEREIIAFGVDVDAVNVAHMATYEKLDGTEDASVIVEMFRGHLLTAITKVS